MPQGETQALFHHMPPLCTEAAAVPGGLLPRGVRALSRGIPGRLQGDRHVWFRLVWAPGWHCCCAWCWIGLAPTMMCGVWAGLHHGAAFSLQFTCVCQCCGCRSPAAAGHKFVRGEPRFVLTAGDPQKKGYLSLPAAGAELAPVAAQVGGSRQCAACLV